MHWRIKVYKMDAVHLRSDEARLWAHHLLLLLLMHSLFDDHRQTTPTFFHH